MNWIDCMAILPPNAYPLGSNIKGPMPVENKKNVKKASEAKIEQNYGA